MVASVVGRLCQLRRLSEFAEYGRREPCRINGQPVWVSELGSERIKRLTIPSIRARI